MAKMIIGGASGKVVLVLSQVTLGCDEVGTASSPGPCISWSYGQLGPEGSAF